METLEKYNQPENAEMGFIPTQTMRQAYSELKSNSLPTYPN